MSWSVIILRSEALQLLKRVAGGEESEEAIMQVGSGQLHTLPKFNNMCIHF